MRGEAMADDRAERMARIAEALEALDTSPLYDYRRAHGYKPVVGEGSLEARVMFVGEAPGEQEALSGRPFVGAAGRVLDALLSRIGLRRQDVYITNIVKDRPPENRNPTPAEVALYAPLLWEQVRIIQPRIIATLGRFAAEAVLGEFGLPEARQGITRLHGRPLQARAPFGDVVIVPLYHPASTFYRPDWREALERDMQVLGELL